jgi:transposase
MERNERLYPISEKKLTEAALSIIEVGCRGKGRSPEVSHYKAFCGILYILRACRPWRDLPEEYGRRRVVYDRFSRGGERGLWGKIFLTLQKAERTRFPEVIVDGATMKVRRRGEGQKGGDRPKGRRGRR